VKRRAAAEPGNAFLTAARLSLEGLQTWMARYADHLETAGRTQDHRELARVYRRVASGPPATFREAMQLVWFAHQAIHVEGHGYSCTPDRIDQILYPYFERDVDAGRLSREEALALCENFVLKQYDNTFWGPEHHLTQGLVLGGSGADGRDQCNALTRVFLQGAANMALPEPLVWLRWHPGIDQRFFDEALAHLAKTTCVPMFWNDTVVTAGLMNLGVSKEDAYNYTPVGCNELGIPGQFYFNPGSGAAYLPSIEYALTAGRGYRGHRKEPPLAPPPGELGSFDQFAAATGAYLRESIRSSYEAEMKTLQAQMRWGQTPLTSCFFHGCVERGKDMVEGTKYNLLSCNGIAFANAVDSLAAIREVVYERKLATLDEVAAACRDNFKGHERLRGKLLAAPKHGNDDPQLDSIIRLVEKMRDDPMHEICRDPRDGSKFGNTHVVRSAAVRGGRTTPATPEGRLAGTPLASSVAASVGCERSGPTALLNSVAKLDAAKSWQLAYQVNIRFQSAMLANAAYRTKVRELVNVYFARGGQQLQVNALDTETLRAAQKNPEQYRDLVVRIAGFSEFFINLTPDMQEEIINRAAHT
jgi:formate C-acetyltransferase